MCRCLPIKLWEQLGLGEPDRGRRASTTQAAVGIGENRRGLAAQAAGGSAGAERGLLVPSSSPDAGSRARQKTYAHRIVVTPSAKTPCRGKARSLAGDKRADADARRRALPSGCADSDGSRKQARRAVRTALGDETRLCCTRDAYSASKAVKGSCPIFGASDLDPRMRARRSKWNRLKSSHSCRLSGRVRLCK